MPGRKAIGSGRFVNRPYGGTRVSRCGTVGADHDRPACGRYLDGRFVNRPYGKKHKRSVAARTRPAKEER